MESGGVWVSECGGVDKKILKLERVKLERVTCFRASQSTATQKFGREKKLIYSGFPSTGHSNINVRSRMTS